jgi:hypothetical protein
MCGVPTEQPAAERARWLAELSAALSEAEQVLRGFHQELNLGIEARELYWRIEAARLEVQSLQLSRSLNGRKEMHPEWIELPPWQPGRRKAG